LAQLDQDFDPSYQRLVRAFQGFMAGWWADVTTPWVVDYHPDWLRHGETLQSLDPHCKILVCVRELGQILGAIEHQHQQTRLLDFPRPLADLTPAERATRLFNDEGAVGRALQSLEGVQDYPEPLQQQLYYVVFEDLITDPAAVMQGIFSWFQLSPWEIDPHQLQSVAPVRDRRHFKPSPPPPLETPRYRIPDRFEITLRDRFPWFYRTFYPGLI
jgi:sulfotransferase